MRYPWALPLLIFTILVLLGANMHPLWGDEAETALFARNILEYGVPKGWDGVNIMGIEDAIVLNKDLINHTSPWAQYYLTAVSFAIFGQSSFTARLPFILFSIASIPLMYLLILKLTADKRLTLLTIFITSLSVPFILFAYQARYYSLVSFAALGLTYCALSLRQAKWWPKLGFVIFGILFFYGNYLIFVSFLISLFVASLVFARRKSFVFNFVILSSVVAVFCAPWYVWMQPGAGRGGISMSNLPNLLTTESWAYLWESYSLLQQANALPLGMLVVLVTLLLIKYRQRASLTPQLFLIILAGIFLLIMSGLSVLSTANNFIHIRQTIVVFPFLTALSAYVIYQLWQWKRFLGALGLLGMIATNIFTLQPLRSLPLEFAAEIINPYQTPDIVVAQYLKDNAKDGDTAWINLNRDHEPLIFHLGKKIKFVNRVSINNPRIFPENKTTIPKYIYSFRGDPDWLIFYSTRANTDDFLTADLRPLPVGVNLSNYTMLVLPILFSDTSRPELYWRSFASIDPAPGDQVFIYFKK